MTRPLTALSIVLSRYRAFQAPLRFVHRRVGGGGAWRRHHPFDAAHGIATSGYLPWWLLRTGSAADAENSGYAGCQPSCLRRALSTIPDPARFTYLDLGCGMGRSLAVASELPFRRIVGVEIAPEIAAAARGNAAVLRERFPERTPAEVVEGDASAAALPEGDLVVFLYHPFGRALVERLVARLVAAAAGREIFFVYENPVHGALLDARAEFRRWHAETVACDTAAYHSHPILRWMS